MREKVRCYSQFKGEVQRAEAKISHEINLEVDAYWLFLRVEGNQRGLRQQHPFAWLQTRILCIAISYYRFISRSKITHPIESDNPEQEYCKQHALESTQKSFWSISKFFTIFPTGHIAYLIVSCLPISYNYTGSLKVDYGMRSVPFFPPLILN